MDGSFAVAIMTNSDSGGSLFTELEDAIFEHYGWPGRDIPVRVPAEITEEELDRLAGTYEGYGLGRFTLMAKDGQLVVDFGDAGEGPMLLRPESPTRFFNATDGRRVEFDIEDGRVVRLRTRGARAERMD